MKGREWTPEEIALLRNKYPICNSGELQKLFPSRDYKSISSAAKRLKIKKVIQRFNFTEKQIQELIRDYANTESNILAERFGCSIYSVYGKAQKLGLKKSDSFIREQHRRLANTNDNLIKTRFRKGSIPKNKGKKMEEWASRETIVKFRKNQYKTGHIPWQTKSDGCITIRKDKRGNKYKMIRVAKSKWEFLSRHVWMQHYGNIPKGYNIVFKDGDTLNCAIENLECISNEALMMHNTLHNYPPELQTAIITKNKILKKIKNYGKKQD